MKQTTNTNTTRADLFPTENARFSSLPMDEARRYIAFITTAEKARAEAAAKEAKTAARTADKREENARAAVARAERLNAAADLDEAAKAAAVDKAAEAVTKAEEARARAVALAEEADRAAADPAAVRIAFTVTPAAIREARADLIAAEAATREALATAKARAALAKKRARNERKAAEKAREEANAAALAAATEKTPAAILAAVQASRAARTAEAAADLAAILAGEAAEEAEAKARDHYRNKAPADPAAVARRAALAAIDRAAIFSAVALSIFPDLDDAPERAAAEEAEAKARAARAALREKMQAPTNAAAVLAAEEKDPEALAAVLAAAKAATRARLLAEARAVFVGYEAPEAVARQSAKARSRAESSPLAWELRREAEARDHYAPDLAECESAARYPIVAATYGNGEAAERAAQTAAAIRADEAKKPRVYRDPAARRAAAEAERVAACIAERAADPAAPFWIEEARRAAFLALNNHYTATRAVKINERPDPAALDVLTDPAARADLLPIEAAETIPDPATDPTRDPAAEEANAAAILAAVEKAAATMTPARRAVFGLLVQRYGAKEIARKRGYKDHKAAREHLAAIRAAVAAFLAQTAPEKAAAIRAAAFMDGATPEARAAAANAEKATRAEANAAAITRAEAATRAALVALSPIRRRLLFALRDQKTIRKAAAVLKIGEATARDNLNATRAALAAAVEKATPEAAAAIRAADLVALAPTLCAILGEEATRAESANDKAAAAITRAEAATRAALVALSPIRRRLLFALRDQKTIRKAAAALEKNEATAREHLAAIRAALVAAVEKATPAEAARAEAAAAIRAADLVALAPTLCAIIEKAA